MDLLPHNQKAYEAVVAHLEHSNRTCVVHPTGTGKSFIALQLIEDNPDARILYITSLATNLLEFWDKVDSLGRRMVLNLSNIPKHIGTGMKGDLDGIEEEDGVDIDDEERERLLKDATEIDESHLTGPLIQFCLYAGLSDLLPDFDFILVDEFHRAGAPQWEGKVKHLLNENENAKIIGFSATPERMDGRDMRALFNYDVASEMELSAAIVNSLLPLPKYWLGKVEIDIIDEDGLPKEKKEKLLRKKGHPNVAKRHLEAGTGMRDVFREALIPEGATHGKFIVFCRTIRNTRVMVKASEEWFDWVDEVHRYEMHSQDRNGYGDFVRDDSDSLRLLFVVDMLTEGVHLKDLDGVFMIRPTESERIYFQQLGRALAVTTQREHPIILDIVSNAGVTRGGLDFLKGVAQEMGKEEEEMDKFFHITAEAADFIAYLEESEYDYYGAMKAFYETNGHLYIPPGYRADGHDVYKVYCQIRSRKNLLSREYREKYDAIGMDWDITYQWMKGFWAASDYFTENLNLTPPSTLGEYHGVWLYDWLKRNREKQDLLIDRQRFLLDSIGMDWTIEDPWEEKYNELLQYKESHGHCDVPGDEGPLGRWVSEQRKRPSTEDKVEKLNRAGFEWDGRASRSRNAWRAGVEHSREYYSAHGDLKVPAGYVCADGFKLGNFVKNSKRTGRLDELLSTVTTDSSSSAEAGENGENAENRESEA